MYITQFLSFLRLTCVVNWETEVTWRSVQFSSYGSCFPPASSSSSSECANRLRKMLVSVLFPDQTSRVALPTLRFTSPMFGFHFWICMCSSSLRCFFLLSQGSIMPNSNRVPRPYFFDDPAGEDADSGVPWVNSSHPHQR